MIARRAGAEGGRCRRGVLNVATIYLLPYSFHRPPPLASADRARQIWERRTATDSPRSIVSRIASSIGIRTVPASWSTQPYRADRVLGQDGTRTFHSPAAAAASARPEARSRRHLEASGNSGSTSSWRCLDEHGESEYSPAWMTTALSQPERELDQDRRVGVGVLVAGARRRERVLVVRRIMRQMRRRLRRHRLVMVFHQCPPPPLSSA